MTSWEIFEEKPGKYILKASYEYPFKEGVIHGVFQFPKPFFHNPYMAEALIEDWKLQNWKVFFSPKNPSEGALQKRFPAKEGVHFGLALGIFLYFTLLMTHVERRSL